METVTFQPWMLLAILPEIALLALGVLILVLDIAWPKARRNQLGWVTAGGLLVIMILTGLFARPGAEPASIFGGMLRLDGTAFVFRLIFLAGAALTALLMVDQEPHGRQGEFYALLLIATLGMSLMASAADLIMLYLAIETTSLPLYIMAGSMTRDTRSVEAGIKYFLFGALTAAVMLYGFSLFYGFTGTTSLYAMAGQWQATGSVALFAATAMALVGFGFKVSAVPVHFWAPDVYEGAPTPVAGYLSTASKAAGFAVLMRVMLALFPDMQGGWPWLVAILSAASMIAGNVLALVQKNVKRLLAYSSIAQAGYMLAGVAAANQLGFAGATFYLISYLVTNLAAFGVVALIGRQLGSDDLSAYAGLHRRNPGLAWALLIALLSLGGIPPLGGFVGKLLVFGAAVQANMVWLAVIGLLTSVVGLFYYLTVIKMAFSLPAGAPLPAAAQPVTVSTAWRVAILICMLGIVLLGTVLGPFYGLSALGASALFVP